MVLRSNMVYTKFDCLLISTYRLFISFQVLQFDTHIVIGYGQYRHPFRIFRFVSSQQLLLQHNNAHQNVLECFGVPTELRQDSTQIEMCVSQRFDLLQFELQCQCIFEICQCRPVFLNSSVVTGKVVISYSLMVV